MLLDQNSRVFVRLCILTLGLEKPVSVRIHSRKVQTRHKGFSGVAGLHFFNESTGRHEIDALRTDTIRGGTLALLAHEFAHAWVEENHPKAKQHGRTFQRTCSSLRKAMQLWGYNLPPLYLKGVDV